MKRNLKVGGCIAIAVLGGLGPTASATNLQIDVTYDNTVTSLSNATQFESDFNAVVSQFEDAITNPVTVDIQVSVGTINGITTPLPSGDVSGSFSASVLMGSTASASFADTEAALAHTGAVLPAIDPTGGGHFYYMPQAEVKALGLSPATFPTSAPYDGYIGFSGATGEFSFSGIPSAGQYSFQTAAMHEIQEVLGRTSTLNGVTSGFAAYPLDLFRYVAPGVTSFTQNTAAGATQAYASADGGVTDLGTFADQSNGFDRSDWETPVNTTSTDAQNAILTPGRGRGPVDLRRRRAAHPRLHDRSGQRRWPVQW